MTPPYPHPPGFELVPYVGYVLTNLDGRFFSSGNWLLTTAYGNWLQVVIGLLCLEEPTPCSRVQRQF